MRRTSMLDKIKEAITMHEHEKAIQLMKDYLENGNIYTDSLAILEASVYLETAQLSNAFHCISEGLKLNPLNYELYFMLGNLYEMQGILKKAYLCYENAIYHSKNNLEDFSFLSSYFESFKTKTNTFVPKVSIVILTLNNLDYTIQCLDSIRKYCLNSSYEIIVVDNGSTDGTKEYLCNQTDITYHFNEKDMGVAGGYNIGIRLSQQENDIFLLSSDTIVTENALFTLRMGLYEHENIGATSASASSILLQKDTDSSDTIEKYLSYGFYNNIPGEHVLEQHILLADFAFLMKRSAYNVIGDFDEQFFPKLYENTDYCTRMILKDYQLMLCRNSFVFRLVQQTCPSLENTSLDTLNKQRYIEKWNINPDYSCSCRQEMLDFMDEQDILRPMNVLEIGCACGATLLGVKNLFPNASVYGIELDEHTAQFASHVANVVQGNIENLDNPFSVSFDYIIIGDVLEHLVHPENLLNKIKHWLSPQGILLTSIPNILHHTAIIPILMGNFAYSDAGVLDRTHLRFFTLYNSAKLLENCGYKIIDLSKKKTPTSLLTSETLDFIQQLSKLPNVVDTEQFLTIQYLFKAKPL